MKTAMGTKAHTNLPATGKGFGIKSKSAGKIIGLLTSLYSSPVTPVRELIVNAVEAKHEANSHRPVEVVINTEKSAESDNILGNFGGKATISSATFTIRDYGTGMDSAMFHDVFLNIAESTKDTSDETVGGFGIGAKAVFMLTDTVTYTSTKDGVTTRSIVSLNNEGTEDNTVSQETDLPNGTTINFDLDGEKARSVIDRIGAEFLDYQDPEDVLVTLDGKDVEVGKKGTYTLENGEVANNLIEFDSKYRFDETVVTIIGKGGIAYRYPIDNFGALVANALNDIDDGISFAMMKSVLGYDSLHIDISRATLRIDLTRDHINPSRESCISSETLDKMCAKVFAEYMNDFVKSSLADLNNAKTPKQWRKAVANIENKDMKKYVFSTVGDHLNMYPIGDSNDFMENMENMYRNDNRFRVLFHGSVRGMGNRNYFAHSGYGLYFTTNMKSMLVPENEKSIYLQHFVENVDMSGDFHYDMVTEKIGTDAFQRSANTNKKYMVYPKFAFSSDYNSHSITDMLKVLFDVETIDSFDDVRKKAMKLGREDYKKKGFTKRGAASKSRNAQDSVSVTYGGKTYIFDTIGKAIDSVENYAQDVEDVTLFPVEVEEGKNCDSKVVEVFEKATSSQSHVVVIASNNISRRVSSSMSRRKDTPISVSHKMLSAIGMTAISSSGKKIYNSIVNAVVSSTHREYGYFNSQEFINSYKNLLVLSDRVSRIVGEDSHLYQWIKGELESRKDIADFIEDIAGDVFEIESYEDVEDEELYSIIRKAPIYGYLRFDKNSIINLYELSHPTTVGDFYQASLDTVIRHYNNLNVFAASILPKGNNK